MLYLKRLLKSALTSLGLFALLLAGCQSKIIYHPRDYDPQDLKSATAAGAERIVIQTSQGQQVAHLFPAKPLGNAGPRVWIVCGGNGSLALDYAYQLESWGRSSHFLFVDYPGYGSCEGSPSPRAIRETMTKLRNIMSQRLNLTPEQLEDRSAVFGHSLGCAAALIAAEEWGIQKAVLCAPFTTMTDMARKLVGTPLCYLNHHRFNNIETLQTLEARGGTAMVLHGDADEVIPVDMARQLQAHFPKTVQLQVIGHGTHNGILQQARLQVSEAVEKLTGS
jgi:uncharacterized protein